MAVQNPRRSFASIWREAIEAAWLPFCKLARIQFQAPWNGHGRAGC